MCVCVCSTNLGFSVEKILLVLVWGTSERLVPAKKKRTPGASERFVANCGVGPSTRGQGDSASLVQRRYHKAVVSLVGPASKVKADCCCAVLPQCTCLLLMLL